MGEADAMTDTVKKIIKQHFGCNADKIGKIRNITNNALYSFTVAGPVSSVHGISIQNFGYIGSGTASHGSKTDFFEDEFDGFNGRLKDTIPETHLIKLKEKVLDITFMQPWTFCSFP